MRPGTAYNIPTALAKLIERALRHFANAISRSLRIISLDCPRESRCLRAARHGERGVDLELTLLAGEPLR